MSSYLNPTDYKYIEQYANAVAIAELLARNQSTQQIEELLVTDKNNLIYLEAKRLKVA